MGRFHMPLEEALVDICTTTVGSSPPPTLTSDVLGIPRLLAGLLIALLKAYFCVMAYC